MGFFDKVREMLLHEPELDKLHDHLLALGMQAEILYEHPLQKAFTRKIGERAESLGLVQVAGKSIVYINVIRIILRDEQGAYACYHLVYLVPLEDIPTGLCWAELWKIKRGFPRRKVVDIEWRGGTLADTLNGDLILKENLLDELQLNRPLDIAVTPEPVYQCARIETNRYLPSGSIFDCLDRIAGHIAPHVAEVNSRPETVLFGGKIEFKPRSKDAEVAECYVTDRHVRIESKKPLQIPWYMVENCHVFTQSPSFVGGTAEVISHSTVLLRYRDESGHKRKAKFEMKTSDAAYLDDTLRNSLPAWHNPIR